MAIVRAPVPDGCRDVIVAALKQRLDHGHLLGLRGSLRLTTGIPRVTLRLRSRPRAQLVSWDFFVLATDDIALASARIDNDRPSFAGILKGAFAARALDAVRTSAAALEASETAYQPIFIDSAPAAIFALALKPRIGRGYFVSILDGSVVASDALIIEPALKRLYDRIAKRSAAEPDDMPYAPSAQD